MHGSPVIMADIGDGKQRRFYLSGDELRQIRTETGRGFWTLYKNFEADALPEEVEAVLRLAMIGGGEDPRQASEIARYYANPPRPLRHAYTLAFDCLNAAWEGSPPKGKGERPLTDAEMDDFFTTVEAALLKSGADLSVLKGRSFAEIQRVFAALNKDSDKPEAPDADTFAAIKAAAKKGRRK